MGLGFKDLGFVLPLALPLALPLPLPLALALALVLALTLPLGVIRRLPALPVSLRGRRRGRGEVGAGECDSLHALRLQLQRRQLCALLREPDA